MMLARVAGRAHLERYPTPPIAALLDHGTSGLFWVARLPMEAFDPIVLLAHDIAQQRCAHRNADA